MRINRSSRRDDPVSISDLEFFFMKTEFFCRRGLKGLVLVGAAALALGSGGAGAQVPPGASRRGIDALRSAAVDPR